MKLFVSLETSKLYVRCLGSEIVRFSVLLNVLVTLVCDVNKVNSSHYDILYLKSNNFD